MECWRLPAPLTDEETPCAQPRPPQQIRPETTSSATGRNRRCTVRRRAVAAALGGILASAAFATPALAADRIENRVTTYPREYVTGVNVQGGSGATAGLSLSRTHSHTVSGSIGISVSVVTASIGYSYSASETATYSYSLKAPSSTTCYNVSAYDNFRRDSFKWIDDISWAPDISGKAVTQDHRSVSYNTAQRPKPSWGC